MSTRTQTRVSVTGFYLSAITVCRANTSHVLLSQADTQWAQANTASQHAFDTFEQWPMPPAAGHHRTAAACCPSGRKYELRVVVYRDGDELRAYPSVVKVNRQAFDPKHPTRESLLNNITTSANETSSSGLNFILPLCSKDTLDTLGISELELQVGCCCCCCCC
jgi:hypothetical protein